MQYIPLHSITFHYIPSHSITFHYIPLQHIALALAFALEWAMAGTRICIGMGIGMIAWRCMHYPRKFSLENFRVTDDDHG